LSASMQLHIAVDGVPADLPAKPQLRRVLEIMQHVVDEGRNAVRGLRAPGGGVDDLEKAFCRLREERFVPASIEFRVIVEGRGRTLIPMIRDELYRIGREALMNAFQHSGAASVELELSYAPREMRLLVRDNGCGIDAEVLRSGREGHWGLVGMRERAERIGGRLKVWSRAAAGTEVELTVPGHIAFPRPHSSKAQSWLSRWRRGKAPVEASASSSEQDQ
jgi:signal transduction histidine kinase